MTKEKAIQEIVAVLKFVQEMSGREVGEIDEKTSPIGDLAGFDSLCGVEASVYLSEKLEIDIPGTNAFVNEKGTKALTVGEMAEAICQSVEKAGK